MSFSWYIFIWYLFIHSPKTFLLKVMLLCFRLLSLRTMEELCLSEMGRTSVSNPFNRILRWTHLTFEEACFICNYIIVLLLHLSELMITQFFLHFCWCFLLVDTCLLSCAVYALRTNFFNQQRFLIIWTGIVFLLPVWLEGFGILSSIQGH